jgi:4-nitrophenyl phosphatase
MDVRGAVVDLDGTVYRGDQPLEGAVEAVRRLRERGMELLFLTNNPTRSAEAYADRLAGMGIRVDPSEILPAGTVTTAFVREEYPGADVYLVGGSGLREQLRAAGLSLVEEPEAADVLVTSHDYGFDYDDLAAGLWALEAGAAFIGTDPDRTYPGEDGRPYPGSGAITRAVAGVADREPDHELGKPSPVTLRLALDRLGLPAEDCLVVGDTPETDIALGRTAGMRTVLVLTGTTDRENLPVEPTPDHVIERFAELPGLLEE